MACRQRKPPAAAVAVTNQPRYESSHRAAPVLEGTPRPDRTGITTGKTVWIVTRGAMTGVVDIKMGVTKMAAIRSRGGMIEGTGTTGGQRKIEIAGIIIEEEIIIGMTAGMIAIIIVVTEAMVGTVVTGGTILTGNMILYGVLVRNRCRLPWKLTLCHIGVFFTSALFKIESKKIFGCKTEKLQNSNQDFVDVKRKS